MVPAYSGEYTAHLYGGFAMVVPVMVLAVLGYVTYLRKVPSDTGMPVSKSGMKDAVHLFQHLWSLLLILTLILVFHIQVVTSVLVSIILSILVYKVNRRELQGFFFSAFEKKMLGNTFLVLVLKEFIAYTGVLEMLPETMAALPLPAYLVFALLFFVATVISGATGAIAMGTPLAFADIPGDGISDVRNPCGKPGIPHSCMSCGGRRLLSRDVRGSGAENAAGFTSVLRAYDGLLSCAAYDTLNMGKRRICV